MGVKGLAGRRRCKVVGATGGEPKGGRWIRCGSCAYLKPASSMPYCSWQGAFLTPALLNKPWQCEGYEPKVVKK